MKKNGKGVSSGIALECDRNHYFVYRVEGVELNFVTLIRIFAETEYIAKLL